MPRDLSELTVGQHWAYRQKQTEPVTCVEVIRLGTAKPPRVQIRFVEDKYEGREEWVPPARLKVLWEAVDPWRLNEQRWAAVRNACDYRRDSPEDNALMMVFDYLPDWDLGTTNYNSDGIMVIPDVDALTANLDLDPDFISGDPVSFVTEGVNRIVPWQVTRVIVERLVAKSADVVISKLEADEQEAREHNRWGYVNTHGTFIDPEISRKRTKPMRLHAL